MASPIGSAVALIKRRPMLAVAGAGVAGVIVFASRSRAEPSPDAVASGAPMQSPSLTPGGSFPFPQAIGPADLATADLANAVREGNAGIINALAGQPALQSAAIMGSIQPVLDTILGKLPPSGAGPTAPPATPVTVPAAGGLTDAQVLAMLRARGHDPARNPNWNPPTAARAGERILSEWINAREADRRRGVPGWDG